MSMGNFNRGRVVRVPVMAATDPSRTSPADDAADAGAGMAHPTVVPTNFESDPSDDE